MNCPNCKKAFIKESITVQHHKLGTQGDCPLCGKVIIFYRNPIELKRNKSGALVKKYPSVKKNKVSKKQRRRDRKGLN